MPVCNTAREKSGDEWEFIFLSDVNIYISRKYVRSSLTAQHVKGSSVVTAVAWVAAVSQIPPLVRELPHAMAVAKRKKNINGRI